MLQKIRALIRSFQRVKSRGTNIFFCHVTKEGEIKIRFLVRSQNEYLNWLIDPSIFGVQLFQIQRISKLIRSERTFEWRLKLVLSIKFCGLL